MEDHQRKFEQRALKNVRTLVDKLERNDQAEIPGRAMLILGGVVVGGVLVIVGVAEVSSWLESRNAERMEACMLDAASARIEESRRHVRGKYPGLTEQQINEIAPLAAREAAKADCESVPGRVK